MNDILERLNGYLGANEHLYSPGTVSDIYDAVAEIKALRELVATLRAKNFKAEFALSNIDNLLNTNIHWETFGQKTRAILNTHYERKS